MRSIKSKLEYSQFPVKLGLSPAPSWKRRAPAPGPDTGARQRRSEKIRAELLKQADKAQGNSEKGDS